MPMKNCPNKLTSQFVLASTYVEIKKKIKKPISTPSSKFEHNGHCSLRFTQRRSRSGLELRSRAPSEIDSRVARGFRGPRLYVDEIRVRVLSPYAENQR